VEQARELIERESKNIAKSLIERAKGGDAQSARWLLAHTAVPDETGQDVRPIAAGIDKPQLVATTADSAPRIMIGVSLGRDFAQLATPQPGKPTRLLDVSPTVSPTE